MPTGGWPGLVLAPFRGVRYAAHRVSGLAQVTSPPYDVISTDSEAALIAADPHNVVRLILPRPGGEYPASPYQEAAAELTDWLAEGILVADAEPTLYVYEQADAADGRSMLQRGLIGALGLVPPQAGIVRPHEGVAPGPVTGRRQLMEATRANLEPIFLLYDGAADGVPGAASRLVDEVATTRGPLVDAVTPDGIRHRLWAVTDERALAEIAADLAPRQALIADGHHRYAAYRQLQRRHRESGDGPGPWDLGLALLVDSTAYPPRLGAVHRVITGLSADAAVKLASDVFSVREVRGGSFDPLTVVTELEAVSRSGIAFAVSGEGRAWLLTGPDRAKLDAAMRDEPPSLRGLPAAVLRRLLLSRLWGIDGDEERVRAVHDASAAIRAADAEPGGTAVLCAAMSTADVYAVAAAGLTVPRKSTSFGPKPRTGLVLRLFSLG